MKADFMKGKKTISGIVVAILAVVLAKYTTEGELTELATTVGQVLGGMLAVYGIVMKIIRRFRKK